MRGSGVKESQVGASRVRYTPRQNVLIAELLVPIAAADLATLTRSLVHNTRLAQAARTVLDLRAAGGDRAFRDVLTEWAAASELPILLVVADEMHVAEVNMAALARGSLVRAFSSSAEAFRHASRATSRPGGDTGTTGKHAALSADERRALLFPRRPSELGLPRLRPRRSDATASGETDRDDA